MSGDLIGKIAIYALPVIFAITLHEAAHGYVARRFGDMTATLLGRVTLNPLKHIDWIGTVLVPVIALAVGGILFGWAKPVPVNTAALRNPKKDMLWVAAAGPGANFAMALFWACVMRAGIELDGSFFARPMVEMGVAGIGVNVVLAVLNLFPLPPLDGGRIAVSLLPGPLAWKFAQLERFGLVILVVLLVTGVLGTLLGPIVEFGINMVASFVAP